MMKASRQQQKSQVEQIINDGNSMFGKVAVGHSGKNVEDHRGLKDKRIRIGRIRRRGGPSFFFMPEDTIV